MEGLPPTLREQWEAIQALAPPKLSHKPTSEEHEILVAHKKRLQNFIDQVEAEIPDSRLEAIRECNKLKGGRRTENRLKEEKRKTAKIKTTKVLVTKVDTDVSLGWSAEKYRFRHVVPFLSHARRSAQERQEDEQELGGINRCVFSNLFVDEEPLQIPSHELLGHGSSYSSALCAESLYMASKCKLHCDARFIVEELTSSFQVAQFGHDELRLNEERKQKLIELGADPMDFLQVVCNMESTEQTLEKPKMWWIRGKDGNLSVRDEWKDIRHNVFLYILRHKFGSAKTVAGQSVLSLLKLMDKGELPLIVEHRQKDGFWGDASNGDGYNVLGKTITQILLEIKGLSAPASFMTASQASTSGLFEPNSQIVEYKIVEM